MTDANAVNRIVYNKRLTQTVDRIAPLSGRAISLAALRTADRTTPT